MSSYKPANEPQPILLSSSLQGQVLFLCHHRSGTPMPTEQNIGDDLVSSGACTLHTTTTNTTTTTSKRETFHRCPPTLAYAPSSLDTLAAARPCARFCGVIRAPPPRRAGRRVPELRRGHSLFLWHRQGLSRAKPQCLIEWLNVTG